MKAIPAILFALGMTGLVAIAMLLVGANAYLNPNGIQVVGAAPDGASAAVQPVSSASDQRLAEAQQLIQQYQQREQQYQGRLAEAVQRLNDANQQIDQADQKLQSYELVMEELQRRGLIRIDPNGQIFAGRAGHDDD